MYWSDYTRTRAIKISTSSFVSIFFYSSFISASCYRKSLQTTCHKTKPSHGDYIFAIKKSFQKWKVKVSSAKQRVFSSWHQTKKISNVTINILTTNISLAILYLKDDQMKIYEISLGTSTAVVPKLCATAH